MDGETDQFSPTVLIVNNDSQESEVLVTLLADAGYRVTSAQTSADAIEQARAGAFDIVIIDAPKTTEMSGLELCYRLKQNSRTNSVAVLLTGEECEEAFRAGADDCFQTPLHPMRFLVRVTQLVERRRLEQLHRDSPGLKQAEEALAQQAERERLVNRITRAVRRSLDPAEVFRTAVNEVGVHLNVDRCVLFMLDTEGGMVYSPAEYTAPGVAPAGREYSIASVAELVENVSRKGVLVYSDAAADEEIRALYEKYLRTFGTRSIMYVAVKAGEEVLGAFALSVTYRLRRWSESDIALARAVADQTGIAIRQAELYQHAEATRAREALTNRLSVAIRSSLDLSEVLHTAMRELGRALGASRVHLRPFDPTHLESPSRYAYTAPGVAPLSDFTVSYDDPIGQSLLREQRILIINDATTFTDASPEVNALLRAQVERTGARSEILCPLVVQGRFRGTLCIHQTDRLRKWTKDDVALVEAVAAQLATSVAQAELFELSTRARKEWETTFDAMSDGIFIFDNNKMLVRINRAGAALEDSSPHLLLGKRCCDILRESGEEKGCIVEKTIDEGRSTTLELTPARVQRPLLVTVEPVGDGGSAMGAVCTVRDLSELREIEAVARDRESLLRNILESARESIFALDREGRFQWCNSATTEVSGYKPEDLKGRHYLDVTYEPDREMVREKFERVLDGEPQTYELRYKASDGSIGYSLVDKAPITSDGQITGVLGIARDITEQKIERERAMQSDKLRALGQLASGVAHDFNNALAAILGRTQLLRYFTDDSRIVHSLDVIQTAAEDAAATVRRIQTFARQSQREELELIDAAAALHDAIEITRTRWENQASERGIDYTVELSIETSSPPPPPHEVALYVMVTASELREVFINLIVNAIDVMPQGGRLFIRGAREGDRVRLSFTDTGDGMTEEVRKRIFEPFFTTKGAHGTGLGLFVSYGIIERFGGCIDVESEAGKGTTFTVDLPAAALTSISKGKLAKQMASPSLSVLVIDDDESVRETLASMLSVLNHRVQRVESGRAALKALAVERFDVVFTDLSMPDMDGWEVARHVRRTRPDTLVVLVTGHGSAAAPLADDQSAVDKVLSKPFDFERIVEILHK